MAAAIYPNVLTISDILVHNESGETGLLPAENVEGLINLSRKQVDDYPINDQRRPAALVTLSHHLCLGYSKKKQEEWLDESIASSEAALDLHPKGNPHRTKVLLIRAWALLARFGYLGEDSDLEEAIQCLRDAHSYEDSSVLDPYGAPESYHDRAPEFHDIGNYLYKQYEQHGRVRVLDASIDFHRDALNRRTCRHPDHFVSLISLATALLERFSRRGSIDDLEESTRLLRDALGLCPRDHPDRYLPYVNLANCLSVRFGHSGQINDLGESIKYYEEALYLCRKGHTGRPLLLSKLAFCLHTRFEQDGNLDDLNRSIRLHRKALKLNPGDHPNRHSTLSNLANTLLARFQYYNCGNNDTDQDEGSPAHDLQEAIDFHREALTLRSEGHKDRSSSLSNLATALLASFRQSGKRECLVLSITYHRKALCLCPEGHRDRSMVLIGLAQALLCSFQNGRCEHLKEAIQKLQDACGHRFSSSLTRLEAAQTWLDFARSEGDDTTLQAYREAMSLFQRASLISPTLPFQYNFLLQKKKYKGLALEAAAHAIMKGKLEQAVELLELGRTLLWTEIRGFRTPLEQLSVENMELADRFKSVSRQLEDLVTSSEESMPTSRLNDNMFHTSNLYTGRSFDEMLELKRQLSDEQEKILKEIQAISGFETFLTAAPFAELQQAASEGPVIMINHCKYRSDALIVSYKDPPVCISLDRMFYEDSTNLSSELIGTQKAFGPGSHEYEKKLTEVMEMIWNKVVSKVVNELNNIRVTEGARIWWCPTSILSALPFHAAGPFMSRNGDTMYLLDEYVSSYTPTLGALIHARRLGNESTNKVVPMVLGIVDSTLPSSKREVINIRHCGVMMKILARDATCRVVLKALQRSAWVHMICHGRLYPEPLRSSFVLCDRELTLLEIVGANAPNAEFAFLSACHTAAAQDLSDVQDEVIHLAAAMQSSGFRSVIGSMWELLDEDAPFLTRDVYEYMLNGAKGEVVEVAYKRAAAGLRIAALELKARGVPTERWVNLIHIGA